MKILFLGNSITLHSPAPHIGWHGNWGMAASAEEKDYVHVLCRRLTESGLYPVTRVRNIADFEREPLATSDEFFDEDVAFTPDVVILRISENNPDEKKQELAEAYEKLIKRFREYDACTVFAVGPFWCDPTAEALLSDAALRGGAVWLSLSHLHEDKSYEAIGEFENKFVAMHPSDKGMKAIADRIFEGMSRAGLLSGATAKPIPDGEDEYGGYSVALNGKPAPIYQVRVSAIPFNRPWPGKQRDIAQTELAGMLTFDMTAPVDISLTAQNPIKAAVVRPLSAKVQTFVDGNKVYFTVRHPGQYSLEIDGRSHNLHIFANEVWKDPCPNLSYTHYFAAGVHNAGTLVLKSGDRMYLEEGAVVYCAIQAFDAENIRIEGRGILDYSYFERTEPFQYERTGLINFVRCRNVTVDGVILRNSSWWTITSVNCSNLYFHNVKSVGMWRYNSDGFDFVCCQNVHVDRCFLRNFDDVVVFKGYDIGEFGIKVVSPEGKVSPAYNLQNNENCLVENCVLWCDWGGALEIGAETATDEYVNFVFRNCDIIHSSDGAMRIQSGDRATVHSVLYDDIRVEYDGFERRLKIQHSDDEEYVADEEPYISDVVRGWMYCNRWSKAGLLGNVYDVTFRNISVFVPQGLPLPKINLKGADAEHGFWNVRVENFRCNGKETEPMIVSNEFTDITLKKQ